jgi:hypothetical protein
MARYCEGIVVFRHILIGVSALILCACVATPGKVKRIAPVAAQNSDHFVALKGYDPVEYFASGKPIVGLPSIAYKWRDVKWQFASEANRDAFVASPEKYAPQFGGYCSFAVSRGTVADIDPKQWAIVDGKLYLNNNAFAQSLWDQDRSGNISAGNVNWPLLRELSKN